MTVVDELACREHGRHQLGPVHDGIEPPFQEPDQMGAGIALHPDCFLVDAAELALGDVAVIAAQLLLGAQLHAVIGELALAALAVLAGAVFAAVDGALGAAPHVLGPAAVDLVLRLVALGHRVLGFWFRRIAPSSVSACFRETCRNRQVFAEATAQTTGRETQVGLWSSLRARYLGG